MTSSCDMNLFCFFKQDKLQCFTNTFLCDLHETTEWIEWLGEEEKQFLLLRTFIGLMFSPLQQSQEGLVYVMVPVPFKTTRGWNMYAWCATMFQGEGVGGLCHCEEALNGNSWHQRSQLTTRTITYWTKKPMEKQHRIYVIGFWVTDPIHVCIVQLQQLTESEINLGPF